MATKRKTRIIAVSSEVHDTLFQVAAACNMQPKDVLESIFKASSLKRSWFILKLLRGNYKTIAE